MELMLICLAVAFMATGKFNKDTALGAYKAGKEPPGLIKARMRHESGGGFWRARPGKSSTPKGRGGTRLMAATKWAHACEKAKTRMESRHQRWRAWYADQAPDRDQKWREKHQRRIARRDERLDRWQGRWTQAKTTLSDLKNNRKTDEAWKENALRDQTTEQAVSEAQSDAQQLREKDQRQEPTRAQRDKAWEESVPDAEAAASFYQMLHGQQSTPEAADESNSAPAETQPDAQVPDLDNMTPARGSDGAAAASSIPAQTNGTATAGGNSMYAQASIQLQNRAAVVEGYQKALSKLGDELAGNGWGDVVHGPLTDMHQLLRTVAGRYRDLAERVKHEGDEVNDAYDDAPWAPDRDALV